MISQHHFHLNLDPDMRIEVRSGQSTFRGPYVILAADHAAGTVTLYLSPAQVEQLAAGIGRWWVESAQVKIEAAAPLPAEPADQEPAGPGPEPEAAAPDPLSAELGPEPQW